MKKATILTLILLLILALAVPALAELRRGSKGADVVELQKRLIELGYLTGEADGSFGPMTEAALEGFQALNHLDVTGVATIKDTTILFSDNAIDLYAPFWRLCGGTKDLSSAGSEEPTKTFQ